MKILTPVLMLFVAMSAMAQLPPLSPARQAERDAAYGSGPAYLTPGNIGRYDDRNNGCDNTYGGCDDGRYDHGRDDLGRGPGRPMPPPMPPGRPMPPPMRPPMPPPPPYYGNDYGPQQTVRWMDNGLNRLPKLISESQTIYVGHQLVNEILVRAIDNRVQIDSMLAYTSSGQVIDLRQLTGSIGEGREVRGSLDYRFSVRIERIVIQASSSNLIGSRAQMQVLLGLAQ